MNAIRSDRQLAGGISGVVFLLGNILCWAIVPVMLRYLTHALDAWTANGVRYPLAAVVYWPILIVAWRSGELDRQTLWWCVVPSFFALGGQVFWALAPYYLPAGAISFFMRFSLVFALAGAMLLFPDERKLLRLPPFYCGLLLSVAGFLVLSISKVQFDVEVTGTGIVMILCCGLFFGFYGVSVRYFLRGVKPLVSFGVVSHFVSVGTVIAMFSVGNYTDLFAVSSRDWVVLVVSSIVGIALGHYFLHATLPRLGAAITSGAQTLSPFLTMLLAWWFLGESMTGIEWCAGLTMICGAATLLYAQHQLVARQRLSLR